MNEKIFVNKVIKQLNTMGFFWKTHGSQFSSGKADIIGMVDGDFTAIEAKVIKMPAKDDTVIPFESKLVTKQQMAFLEQVWSNEGVALLFVGVDGSKSGRIFLPSQIKDMTKTEFQHGLIDNFIQSKRFKTAVK